MLSCGRFALLQSKVRAPREAAASDSPVAFPILRCCGAWLMCQVSVSYPATRVSVFFGANAAASINTSTLSAGQLLQAHEVLQQAHCNQVRTGTACKAGC